MAKAAELRTLSDLRRAENAVKASSAAAKTARKQLKAAHDQLRKDAYLEWRNILGDDDDGLPVSSASSDSD